MHVRSPLDSTFKVSIICRDKILAIYELKNLDGIRFSYYNSLVSFMSLIRNASIT